MQSKTSCFKTIVIKNITRFWPLWGLNTLLGMLIPFMVIVSIGSATTRDAAETFYGGATGALPAYYLIYACAVAMAVWGYLYTGRSVGLMHSLPVSRKTLFAASFVSGIIMLLIPVATAGIFMEIIFVINGIGVFRPFLLTAVIVLSEGFIFFAIATFMAHLTGHIFGLPVLYFILNFLAIALEYISGFYSGELCYGLSSGYNGNTEFLSPVVMIYNTVHDVSRYGYEYEGGYNPANQYIEGWGTLGIYTLVAACLVALSLFLYLKRKSETAGEVVSAKSLRPVALACFTVCCALTGGIVLFYLFAGDEATEPMMLLAFCMILSAFVGYYGGQMLLQRKVRVFNKSTLPGFAVAAVACVFYLAILRGGAFGRETYIPKTDKVVSASMTLGYSSWNSVAVSDEDGINKIREIHKLLIDKKKEVLAAEHRIHNDPMGIECWGEQVHIIYTYKSGRTVTREYMVYNWKDSDALKDITEDIDAYVNGIDVLLKYFNFNDPEYEVASFSLGNQYWDGNDARALYTALIKDVKDGRYVNHAFENNDMRTIHGYVESKHGNFGWSNREVIINEGMTEFTAVLKELLKEQNVDYDIMWQNGFFGRDYGYYNEAIYY